MIKALMFHSVGNTTAGWYRKWLSCETHHFDRFCRFLSKKNYRTLDFDEWCHLMDNPKEITGKETVLTFDDGYLDNWVYAYPVLKKYGLKGTIFVNPEFVDPSIDIRFNSDDAEAGRCRKEDLHSLGFLNWNELRALDKSGHMDIQSHSMSHNFYFHSDKIVDLYQKQPKYDWLAWISTPRRKPFYLNEDQTELVPEGFPVFAFGRALELRRYQPSEEFVERAVSIFQESGRNKSKAMQLLGGVLKDHPGTFETDDEMEKRYRYELFESKRIIEEQLDKKVEYLCWPGGGYNPLSLKLSEEAGYRATTVASKERHQNMDNSGSHKRVQRFGMGSFISTSKKHHLVRNPNYLVEIFRGKTGNSFYRNMNRLRKLTYRTMDTIIK